MRSYICMTCAVQQAPSEAAPKHCPICEDERQYVRQGGQAWTTIEELRLMEHRLELRELEPGLVGVGVPPSLGSGQRALLAGTAIGNVRWDCGGHIGDDRVAAIRARAYRFDRISAGWWDRVVRSGGIAAVDRSAERYLRWIGQDPRLG